MQWTSTTLGWSSAYNTFSSIIDCNVPMACYYKNILYRSWDKVKKELLITIFCINACTIVTTSLQLFWQKKKNEHPNYLG